MPNLFINQIQMLRYETLLMVLTLFSGHWRTLLHLCKIICVSFPERGAECIKTKKKQKNIIFSNFLIFSSAASPVHIVGPLHPYISQPPKVLNVFPEDKKVISENLYSFQSTEKNTTERTIAERAGMPQLTLTVLNCLFSSNDLDI